MVQKEETFVNTKCIKHSYCANNTLETRKQCLMCDNYDNFRYKIEEPTVTYTEQEAKDLALRAWYEGKRRTYEIEGREYLSFEEWLTCTGAKSWFEQNKKK